MKVKTYRVNAILTGVFYLLGTFAGVLSLVLTNDIFDDKNFLEAVSVEPFKLSLGAFFILVMGVSLTLMTIFLFPLFRKDSETLAVGLVVFRGAIEGTLYAITSAVCQVPEFLNKV